MWTPSESAQIHSTARAIVPNVVVHALPQGLQVQRGPDAVVEYIEENLPALVEEMMRVKG